MINFRFHIISLVAVFLALGVGLAMGAAFIDKATVDTLRGQLDGLQRDKEDLQNRVGELEAQAELSQRLADEGGLQLLAGHLTDVPVVQLSMRGVDEGMVGENADAIAAANAEFGGTLWFTDRVVLDDESERTDLAEALGVDDTDPDDLRRLLTSRLGNTLAAAADPVAGSSDDVPGSQPTPEPVLVADLRAAGFLELDAPPTPPSGFEVIPAAGARYVVLSGPDAVLPDEELLLPLVERIAAAAEQPATVAGESTPAEDAAGDGEEPPPSLVTLIRDDDDLRAAVSTVDDMGTFAGEVAVVLAVEHLASEQVGHYGTADGADALVPPPIEGG